MFGHKLTWNLVPFGFQYVLMALAAGEESARILDHPFSSHREISYIEKKGVVARM